jgi:hypothetical protein
VTPRWLFSVALLCAACSAAPDDGGALSDHGGELALDPPEQVVEPGASPVQRVELSAPATPSKPTPDPWRISSGVGKPTPDPWSSWEACEAVAETSLSAACEEEQDLPPASEASRR